MQSILADMFALFFVSSSRYFRALNDNQIVRMHVHHWRYMSLVSSCYVSAYLSTTLLFGSLKIPFEMKGKKQAWEKKHASEKTSSDEQNNEKKRTTAVHAGAACAQFILNIIIIIYENGIYRVVRSANKKRNYTCIYVWVWWMCVCYFFLFILSLLTHQYH